MNNEFSKEHLMMQKCADVFYKNYEDLPPRLKEQLSVHSLHVIFSIMVRPAINQALICELENKSCK